MNRYPNYLSIVAPREDGDFELLVTLNGDTIESSANWNWLVTHVYETVLVAHGEAIILNRMDAPDVLTIDDIKVGQVFELEGISA